MATSRRPARMQRYAGSLERATRAIPAARWVLMNPVVAIPGYWFATAVGYTWGAMLGRALPRKAGGVFVARGLPAWAYGRGGTTIGAVYLTGTTVSEAVLRHEAVHRAQWRRYGVAFIPLYVAAGPIAQQNRFEREAGLRDGGYREDENH